MKNIQRTLISLLLGLTALWRLAESAALPVTTGCTASTRCTGLASRGW
ncbi:MAG: hypothetical protein RIS48_960 [Pseudomonadota bacterium]